MRTMHVLAFLADWIYIFSTANLFWRIWVSKSCLDVSSKSLFLFSLVWTARFVDVFIDPTLSCATAIKVFFLLTSYASLFLTYCWSRKTGSYSIDTFRIEPLIVSCVLMSAVIARQGTPIEMLWTFSVLLESVAAVPQLHILSKSGPPGSMIRDYLLGLAMCSTLYVVHWVYRSYFDGHFNPVVFMAGGLQTTLIWAFLLSAYFHPVQEKDQSNGSCRQTSYYHQLIENLADIVYASDSKHHTLNELHKQLNKRGMTVSNEDLKKNGFKNFKMLVEDQPWLVLFDKGGNWYVRRRMNAETRPPRPLVDANRRANNAHEETDDNDGFVDPYEI